MWPDNETTNDLLGFQVHADLIRSLVTNPSMLPTIVGIFGDWGGGKTSIMRMLERDLASDKYAPGTPEHEQYGRVAVLYLNTWLFEGYDDAKTAILTSILLELASHKRLPQKAKEKVLSLMKSVNWMRVARLGFSHVVAPAAIALATGGAAAIPGAIALAAGLSPFLKKEPADQANEVSEKLEGISTLLKDVPEEALDVRTFRDRFRDMLSESGISSLVVLIDDLDRCMPDRIVDSLEAIKLFLNVERTAFIIGADPRIVRHAIRLRYAERSLGTDEEAGETDALVKDYLEKVIQVPYYLPRLSAAEIEGYMALLFCHHHLTPDDVDICIKASVRLRDFNRYSTFGYTNVKEALEAAGKRLDQGTQISLSFCSSAAPLIADGLKGNPRQVKRFLNAFLLRKQLARVAKLENIRDSILVKLMILEYSYDKLFNELFEWQSRQEGRSEELREMEQRLSSPDEGKIGQSRERSTQASALWDSPRVRRWLVTEPRLSEVDLRDYFWIARDKLASTFSGLTMVSPLVRKTLEGLLSGSKPKRNASVKLAHEFAAEDQVALLNLIDQGIKRSPADNAGYEALRLLLQDGSVEAAKLLANILEERSLEIIPPAVGMNLGTLIKMKPEMKQYFERAIVRIRAEKTAISIAFAKAGV